MKRFLLHRLFAVFLLVFSLSFDGFAKKLKECPPDSEKILIKLATLAPSGTFATEGIKVMGQCFDLVGPEFGFCTEFKGYFGGVMGDDPQMIQKARAGQLDMLATTLNGLPLIADVFDVFNMAYLIEDYGMFDYVMARNAPLINKVFWDNGWLSMALIVSDGPHDLYLAKEYRTIEELGKNLKAANYTGGPDDSFFKALRIPQLPCAPTDMFTSVRAKVMNAALLPAVFATGMQLYTTLPYIIKPTVRYSTSALILTKRKWETLPWDFRVFIAFLQPSCYYAGAGIVRDAAYAFMGAMVKHGSKQIVLTPEQLKLWKEQVAAYREKYIGNDKLRRELYNAIQKSIQEYKTSNPIEKQMYISDPTYRNFPDKVARIGQAMYRYINTRDPSEILKLHRDKVLEKWRVYDVVMAWEHYVKTGDHKLLEQWMRSYYIPEVVDEIFTKHMDSIKRLYGSEKAIKNRMKEVVQGYNIGAGFYKGFQKAGFEANKAVNKEY